ncbi:unnamed protein product [Macrosiphum euphorbiae]|uniref:Uncharacterized protein n=1 Tax=Macrosiphum euphorbiae TaxID=13131 RepID=A0AAV0X3D5_9HEMI|nr:unnamed protein product [Macrosiphum euphorbiae]
MDSVFLDVFFPRCQYSEAPISVITNILSGDDTSKFLDISYQFRKLRFTKVKDLAGATIAKISSVKLSGDTLTLLYGAMEKYCEHLNDLLVSSILVHQNGNLQELQTKCNELLMHRPRDFEVILLHAQLLFDLKKYQECINCLINAKTFFPNNTDFFDMFAFLVYFISLNDN